MDFLQQLVDFIEPFLWVLMLTGIVCSIGACFGNEMYQKLFAVFMFVVYSIFSSFIFCFVSFLIWIILSVIPWNISDIRRVAYSGMIAFPILFYYLARFTKN